MTIKRMSHAVYDTRYQLVWTPKHRKWILEDKVKDSIKGLFGEVLVARDCEVLEMEIAEHHVHILSPLLNCNFGYCKIRSAVAIL